MTRLQISLPGLLVAGALVLTGCAPSEQADSAAAPELGPAKVTAADYRPAPTPTGDGPLASIDADGNVAPFGMASRAKRDVQPAPVAKINTSAAAADASSAVYGVQCVACHGADAQGVQGLGLNLVESALVANSNVDELVAFLQAGRGLDSPDNVSGVPMPSFAWMPAEDLNEVAAYLKSL